MSDSLPIDIRDQRLRGGRLLISSRTTKKNEHGRRVDALYWSHYQNVQH